MRDGAEALDARRRSQMEAERRQATLAVTVLSAIGQWWSRPLTWPRPPQALLGEGPELADIELLRFHRGLEGAAALAKLPLRTPRRRRRDDPQPADYSAE